MTPKIIQLKQAPVVLAEIPDHYRLYTRSDGSPFCTNIRNMSAKVVWQHDGEYIGILSDLTEDQFAECVNKIHFEDGDVYKDYRTNLGLSSAKESFQSLLESEKVYMDNPYEHLKEGMTFAEECENKWQEAQQRTIDPKRTVVLLRKEGA